MRPWGMAALAAVAAYVLAPTLPAQAYDIDTHRELGTIALGMSRLDAVLRTELGVPEGVEWSFRGRSAVEIIHDAAGREDIPFFRTFNHFHDPLRFWDSAGLRAGPVQGQSSVRWGQNPVQASWLGGGTWSWPLARRRYLDALTTASPPEREALLSQTLRSVGQLMHLVQDSAVPAHVRNDPHPPVVNSDPYENHIEYLREKQRVRFVALLREPNPVEAESLSLLQNPRSWPAGLAPVVRLIDSDTYLGADPTILAFDSAALGLAEFTNGNFMSSNTLFGQDYPYPRLSSLEPEARWEDEGVWWRRYFKRTREGVKVEHFAAEGLLYEAILTIYGRALPASYTLTDAVHEDYAAYLLPRAIGYSAALLDHFFRGRLLADVVDDPGRPGGLMAAMTNMSDEVLGAGGEVSVHADDTGGRRGMVGTTRLTQDVPPRGTLPPVELEPLGIDATTRFVAVYQGALGAEQPGGGSPGAVIGKVFRPTGVEEVFSDGVGWSVRTAEGVFPLPFTLSEYEGVQWGDEPSTLVARTPFGPGRPSRVDTYRLARDPSGRAPFRLTENLMIDATKMGAHPFPFGLDTGPTVRFRHVVDYRQQLARVEQRVRMRHVEGTARYEVLDIDFVGPDIETTVEAPGITFETDFPIVLDAAHHASRGPQDYAWDLVELAADASDRVLGLVVVTLIAPPLAAHTEPVFAVDDAGRTVATAEVVTIVPRYPEGLPPMWFLVDLGTAGVLASTAEPKIEIELRESRVDGPARLLARDLGFYWRHRLTYVDGPSAGQEAVGQWLGLGFRTDTPPAEWVRDVAVQGGFTALEVRGALRRELRSALAGAGFSDHVLAPTSVITDLVYGCTQTDPVGGCRAIRIHGQGGELARTPASLENVRRPRPEPGGRLVVLATDFSPTWAPSGPPIGALVAWYPTRAEAAVRHRPPAVSPADGWTLGSVTATTALVTSVGEMGSSTVLVPLDGGGPATVFPGLDLAESFVLLDPDRLYNTRDLRFYRSTPPLTPTALPARLADAVPHASGDFHAVRLP